MVVVEKVMEVAMAEEVMVGVEKVTGEAMVDTVEVEKGMGVAMAAVMGAVMAVVTATDLGGLTGKLCNIFLF